jgi:triacylglycerol esterase/lipase EstA (alpha/beta hydrolase family)
VNSSAREPILFLPGTATTPDESFGWNLLPTLALEGYPYCTVAAPDYTLADIAISAEYVVYAIRTMHGQTGRTVNLIGFSQGAGLLPRWALKYWPDARAMTDHLISLDPDNRGTLTAPPLCLVGGCAPALWQQRPDSAFIAALNDGPMTYASVAYTTVYSEIDDVVIPDDHGESAALPPGPNVSNIALQKVCPIDDTTVDHFQVLSTAVTYAAVVDSLDHPGEPASTARFPADTCGKVFGPAMTATSVASAILTGYETSVPRLARYHVSVEPPVPPYARG